MTTTLTRTLDDWEKAQLLFPDAKVELAGGKIIIMAPSGMEAEEVSSRFLIKLGAWVDEKNLRAENLARAPKKSSTVVPDLVVEVKSPSDNSQELREKIVSFLTQGSLVGILVDPDTKRVEVLRLNLADEILSDADTLTLPELFPGWSLPISSLWARDFSV